MGIARGDTVKRARTNRQRNNRLRECQEELDLRAAPERAALHKERQTLYDEALIPLRDVLQRLKNVDLKLASIDRPTDGVPARPRPFKSAVPAVVGTLAGTLLVGAVGQLVVGQAAETGAIRLVKAFGAASTGRKIATLSGAAARNATEAWFGRGPIASGGGGRAAGKAILSKIHKTSGDAFGRAVVTVQFQVLEAGRRERAQDLARREAEMSKRQDAALALNERSMATRRVLQDLRVALVRELTSLIGLVEACDDFAQYDSPRRAEVAAAVDLYSLAAMVMNCPITDMEGQIAEESVQVVVDAEARLRAMKTEL